ncbi:MAG: glutamate--tRNA ligase [Chloroflexota bacterium]|nr:glutamate--tRNA ligase [Chloroflexota bacterium]MDQ5864395.1 glutamate--tRNA ligase [Chloroflexota bacterium]
MADKVRLRIAPSPTGDPHVGTAYMSLFNKAYAHRHGGSFVLRIEDTDQTRYNPTSVGEIIESLRWLDLMPDEGPGIGGEYGPYVQTERRELYIKHAHELVEKGHAYRCFCTSARLEEMRKEQAARHEPPRYDRHCLRLSPQEIEGNLSEDKPYTIRMLVPDEGTTSFQDLIRGEISFENKVLDDQIILKSDGLPTYHLAVVVDDHYMEISHITRAEEWISSTPKHILLYNYFGWELPKFAHFPLLRNADRSKISKRKNNTSLKWYREQGYLPEAMINFLALMGWSMPNGEEIFTFEDVKREFTFERMATSGPIFDLVKLTSINGKYIRTLSDKELHERLLPYLPEGLDEERVRQAVPVIKDRLTTLGEFAELTAYLFGPPPDYDASSLVPKKGTPEAARAALERIRGFLAGLPEPWAHEEWESGMRALAAELGLKAGDIFMVLRVAVTGSPVSPPLFESIEILGKEETLRRVDAALAKLGGGR